MSSARSQPTYKGLKLAMDGVGLPQDSGSQPTYKGLKPDCTPESAYWAGCSQPTYKGLKLRTPLIAEVLPDTFVAYL